jgi:hypothetical protein
LRVHVGLGRSAQYPAKPCDKFVLANHLHLEPHWQFGELNV